MWGFESASPLQRKKRVPCRLHMKQQHESRRRTRQARHHQSSRQYLGAHLPGAPNTHSGGISRASRKSSGDAMRKARPCCSFYSHPAMPEVDHDEGICDSLFLGLHGATTFFRTEKRYFPLLLATTGVFSMVGRLRGRR